MGSVNFTKETQLDPISSAVLVEAHRTFYYMIKNGSKYAFMGLLDDSVA